MIKRSLKVRRIVAQNSRKASISEVDEFLHKTDEKDFAKISPYVQSTNKQNDDELNSAIIAEVTEELAPLIRKMSSVDGRYQLSDKAIALMFMEYSVVQSEDGEFLPRFNLCSQALSIPERTLRGWWEKKDEIRKIVGHTVDNLPTIISTKLKFLSVQVLDEISRRTLADFNNKELLMLLEKAIKITRLLDGKSTENLAIGLPGIDSHVGK